MRWMARMVKSPSVIIVKYLMLQDMQRILIRWKHKKRKGYGQRCNLVVHQHRNTKCMNDYAHTSWCAGLVTNGNISMAYIVRAYNMPAQIYLQSFMSQCSVVAKQWCITSRTSSGFAACISRIWRFEPQIFIVHQKLYVIIVLLWHWYIYFYARMQCILFIIYMQKIHAPLFLSGYQEVTPLKVS